MTSFAGTTLDSAVRIQRYIIRELGTDYNINFLTNKHVGTSIAMITAAALALAQSGGKEVLLLWPLFGMTNQLLTGLVLLMITVYLLKRKMPAWITANPMVFNIFMTGWAMLVNLRTFWNNALWHLVVIGILVLILEAWVIGETVPVAKWKSN